MKLFTALSRERAAQRERTINAQCRADEVRHVLRRGTEAQRVEYIAASTAWRADGEPDVFSVTLWHAGRLPATAGR